MNLSVPSASRFLGDVLILSSCSLSFRGLHVNFNVEFAQLAWRIYSSICSLFVKDDQQQQQQHDEPSVVPVSHTPRRIAFMTLGLALATIVLNLSYASSTSPCLWRAHTNALADLQISRVGMLLNSTTHSTSRTTEITGARIGLSELRTYVQERRAEGTTAAALDAVLKRYSDDMVLAMRKYLRVDASLIALVHM